MKSEIATVTSKGQVTLPINVRKSFGIKKNSKLIFYVEGDSLYIEKYGNPLKYAGFLKDSKIKHITNKELKNIRAAGKIFDNKNAN